MKLSILLVLFGISQVFGGQGIHGRNFGNFIEMGPRGPEPFWCGFQFPGEDREVVPAPHYHTEDCIFLKGLPISFHTLYIRAVSLVKF